MKTLITETQTQQAISAVQRLVNIPSYLPRIGSRCAFWPKHFRGA